MQLEVHDGVPRDRSRHADCLLPRPRVRGDPAAEIFSASHSAVICVVLSIPVSERHLTALYQQRSAHALKSNGAAVAIYLLTSRHEPERGHAARPGERWPASGIRQDPWISRRDSISLGDRAPCTDRGHIQISGLSAVHGGSATYWERLMTIEGKAVLVTGANR